MWRFTRRLNKCMSLKLTTQPLLFTKTPSSVRRNAECRKKGCRGGRPAALQRGPGVKQCCHQTCVSNNGEGGGGGHLCTRVTERAKTSRETAALSGRTTPQYAQRACASTAWLFLCTRPTLWRQMRGQRAQLFLRHLSL